jgi:hypothetical protein
MYINANVIYVAENARQRPESLYTGELTEIAIIWLKYAVHRRTIVT